MSLIMRGKSKDRVEVQWGGIAPSSISVIAKQFDNAVLYQAGIKDEKRINFRLNQLNFAKIPKDQLELELIAITEGTESDTIQIQKCKDCQSWGHVKDDGYCKHCGRRIRSYNHTRGFPKLELSNSFISLWNGVNGYLWKNKEADEIECAIQSWGHYEDADHPKSYVDILEEKYNKKQAQSFIQLYHLLEKSELIPDYWEPPLASFQEEFQRTLWIYYPKIQRLKEGQTEWRRISAYNYISSAADLLSTEDVINIGIQLCDVALAIHRQGYLWGSLKLHDLILTKDRKTPYNVGILLKSRDITWNDSPSQKLLDTCLIPWELYWDSPQVNEATEVYIIAAALYILKAKSPNLLSYNPMTHQNGLPSLRLFEQRHRSRKKTKDPVCDYFESIINQALILHPEERHYQSIAEFRSALLELLQIRDNPQIYRKYSLDVGEDLDVGNAKRENDFSPNQDAIFTTTASLRNNNWGMFVLCDGISTATIGTGEQASRAVCETFREWWASKNEEQRERVCRYASTEPEKAYEFLNFLVNKANQRISKTIQEISNGNFSKNDSIMGSTITAGLIHGGVMVFGWIGDSPIYRFSKFGWERLNFSDNERNARILAGKSLDESFSENGNAITHCVGAHFYQDTIHLHFDYVHLHPEERILICSDGIPDYIEQETMFAAQENHQMLRIDSILRNYNYDPLVDARALVSILISSVNMVGGGRDNLSAILLRTISSPTVLSQKAYERLRYLALNSASKTSKG